MRILLIHTQYIDSGGENAVFDAELKLFQPCSVKTEIFVNKPCLAGLMQFIFNIWNPISAFRVFGVIKRFRPDVMHVHNLHFAASPSVLTVARWMGIPVVYTLHNYRLLCPSATLYHEKAVFTKSLEERFPWTAVRKGVYRNSRLLTFWLAFGNWLHHRVGTYNKVNHYITLTSFAKEIAKVKIKAPITVKGNFVEKVKSKSDSKRGDHFLFVGRLSEEKGILHLLYSFKNTKKHIRIVGDGPMQSLVIQYAKKYNNIEYLGMKKKPDVLKEMRTCSALIFPSIWLEPFGLTIIEAFSCGTPVIAGEIGTPASLIVNGHNGLHYQAGCAKNLSNALAIWTALSQTEKEMFGHNALACYEAHYTPEKNKEELLAIYASVLAKITAPLPLEESISAA